MSNIEVKEKAIKFVFLDDRYRPFMVCTEGLEVWLYYWHSDKCWVSLRPVTQSEIWSFPSNLTEEEQELYHKQHEVFMNRRQGYKYFGKVEEKKNLVPCRELDTNRSELLRKLSKLLSKKE